MTETALGEMTLEDAVMHYGVLGMKWGRTRVKADAGQIREARGRVGDGQQKLAKQRGNIRRAPVGAKRDKERAKYSDMKTSFLKSPDRVTASRLTRGEKAAAVLLGVGTIGIVGTSVASRRIERKQDKGKYDRKN